MRKLMLIIMILVVATSIYSDDINLSEWWEGLTRDEKIEVLQTYWEMMTGTIIIEEIEYLAVIEGVNLKLTPIYPEGQDFYILSIGNVMYDLEVPDLIYEGMIEPKPGFFEKNTLPFLVGVIIGGVIIIAIQ